MWARRTIYSFALAGAALFSVLYPFWFSWYLLVLLITLAAFDLLVSLPGMLKRRIVFSAPKVLKHNEDGILVITTIAEKPYPVRCIKAWLRVSGDIFSVRRRFFFSAEKDSRYEVTVDTSRSGVTVFEAGRIWTVSLIGLFCIPRRVNCRAAVLILPEPVKPPNTIALPRGVILRPKPGGGFSEDYDLRPYRKGDPIRSVHWKVSAKFDSLLIREPLVPPAHSRLVHTELWNGAKERELILGRLLWVCAYLLKWDLPHYVRLGDAGPVAEITGIADLYNYLFHVLSGMVKVREPGGGAGKAVELTAAAFPAPVDVPARFGWLLRIDAKGAENT